MDPHLEALLDAFVRACLDVFGEEEVEGVLLHGSAAKGGFIPGYSDIDLQVFLSPECFEPSGSLPDETVFVVQERIGPLLWQEGGFRYPQAYFIDAARPPEWWTGAVPGGGRVLWGRIPSQLEATAPGLLASSRRWLTEELPRVVAADLAAFVDADDASLPRRLRLLGTRVTPTVFALLTADAPDPLAVWAQPKDQALRELLERFPEDDGPRLAERFFADVAALYGGRFDADRARLAFRVGVGFLRWAERKALEMRLA